MSSSNFASTAALPPGFEPGTAAGDVQALLADAAFAAQSASDVPLLVAAGEPLALVFASEAARKLLGTRESAAIADRLFNPAVPAGRRLSSLAMLLPPGAPPRLERVRLVFGTMAELVTLLCRTVRGASGGPLLIVQPAGIRAALLDRPLAEPAPPETSPGETSAGAAHPAPPANEQAAADAPAARPLPKPHFVASAVAAAAHLAGTVRQPQSPPQEPAAPEAPASMRKSIRFAWRSDADDVLRDISPDCLAALGLAPADMLGRDWQSLAARHRLDPEGALAAALARRSTWSGLDLEWTAPAGRTPVTLGGAPLLDAARRFAGYKGFGTLHLARTEALAQPQVAPDAGGEAEREPAAFLAGSEAEERAPPVQNSRHGHMTSPEASDNGSHGLAAAPSGGTGGSSAGLIGVEHSVPAVLAEGEADVEESLGDDEAGDPVAATGAAAHAATDGPGSAAHPFDRQTDSGATSHQPIAAFAPAPPESGLDATDVLPAAGHAADESEDETASGEAVLPPRPGAVPDNAAAALVQTPSPQADDMRSGEHRRILDPAALHQALRETAQGAGGEPATALETPETGGLPKIVHLRPFHVVPKPPAPGTTIRDKLAGLQAVPPVPEKTALSPAERNNFREIARSLGAVPPPEPRAPANLPEVAAPSARQLEPAGVSSSGAGDYFALLQRLPAGVLVARGGETLFANKNLLDLLGYADEQAFAASGGLERMFEGRGSQAIESAQEGGPLAVAGFDGEVQMVEVRVQTLDWNGAPASLVTIGKALESDLAQRLRAAELDLRQRETETRELHAILDTATDGVAVLDENGVILSLNRSGEALFGYEQNEVAGKSFTMLIAGESQAAANGYLDGLKRNGVASVLNDGREVLGRARKGGAIPMFMTLGRVGTGTSPKFCAVLRDLTQWKRAERELGDARKEAERASALKSDFLAKISHEIRTPLNAILGFAEVIIEERFGAIGNERYKDYLKDIHASGAHVMSLVNDLLDLSKIEAGKMDMNFASVDANRIVAESVALMQPVAARERVVIRQSLAPRLPNVVADERALRQIVLNLVSNAIKFNNAGGQVIVSTALTDAGHAVLRFRDTGIGMTDAEVEMAMEPFRQLQTSNRQGGTGLGLPLTKALVEANRASFTIKSKKNEGTLVEVAFPPTRVLAE